MTPALRVTVPKYSVLKFTNVPNATFPHKLPEASTAELPSRKRELQSSHLVGNSLSLHFNRRCSEIALLAGDYPYSTSLSSSSNYLSVILCFTGHSEASIGASDVLNLLDELKFLLGVVFT